VQHKKSNPLLFHINECEAAAHQDSPTQMRLSMTAEFPGFCLVYSSNWNDSTMIGDLRIDPWENSGIFHHFLIKECV
jgi:hypothetical protein